MLIAISEHGANMVSLNGLLDVGTKLKGALPSIKICLHHEIPMPWYPKFRAMEPQGEASLAR